MTIGLQIAREHERENLMNAEARGRAEGEARGRAEGEARGRAEGEARGRAEGAFNNLLENITIIMDAGNMSLDNAMKLLRIPEEKQPKIREALANR